MSETLRKTVDAIKYASMVNVVIVIILGVVAITHINYVKATTPSSSGIYYDTSSILSGSTYVFIATGISFVGLLFAIVVRVKTKDKKINKTILFSALSIIVSLAALVVVAVNMFS